MSSQPIPAKLSPDLWQALHGIKAIRVYPKGSRLFQQGNTASGVYVVESGEVRVLLPTGQRRPQLLEVAGPGTIQVMQDTGATALAVDASRTLLLDRDEMLERANRAAIAIIGYEAEVES